jgi:hypothetical protein
VSAIGDLMAWFQRGLQQAGEAVSLRVREEPLLTVGLFRAAVTMLSASASARRVSRSP